MISTLFKDTKVYILPYEYVKILKVFFSISDLGKHGETVVHNI